jgi:hypothetical protein
MLAWLTVIGLAATPALILGQSAACAAGIGFGFDPVPLVAVVAATGFVQGLGVAGLAALAQKIPRLHRALRRLHAPRFDAWIKRWGPWAGLGLGPAVAGQEPVIIALVWLGAPLRRLVLPLALSNAAYAFVYYEVVRGAAGLLGALAR